MEEVR